LTLYRQRAPAKVNLALHVTSRRPDGFHELESLFVFAALCDELQARENQDDTLVVSGPFAADIPSGADNLVLRAASAFRERWPNAAAGGLAFELVKNLPVAAGIGSGSADAAATLRMLAATSRFEIETEALYEVALGIGADVPACVTSVPCLVSGIGENLLPVVPFPECYLVLINPLIPISTPEVFSRLSSTSNPGLPGVAKKFDDLASLAMWLDNTRNDLASPATVIVPEIGEISDDLGKTQGCLIARMSGSGATVFGLFATGDEADQAGRAMRKKWHKSWVASAPVVASA